MPPRRAKKGRLAYPTHCWYLLPYEIQDCNPIVRTGSRRELLSIKQRCVIALSSYSYSIALSAAKPFSLKWRCWCLCFALRGRSGTLHKKKRFRMMNFVLSRAALTVCNLCGLVISCGRCGRCWVMRELSFSTNCLALPPRDAFYLDSARRTICLSLRNFRHLDLSDFTIVAMESKPNIRYSTPKGAMGLHQGRMRELAHLAKDAGDQGCGVSSASSSQKRPSSYFSFLPPTDQ